MKDALENLYKTIISRKGSDPKTSHTAKLFEKGIQKIAQKMGEEAVETVIAAVDGKKSEVISESADLLYHLMVLWADRGVTPADIVKELDSRKGVSGIEEKKKRKKQET